MHTQKNIPAGINNTISHISLYSIRCKFDMASRYCRLSVCALCSTSLLFKISIAHRIGIGRIKCAEWKRYRASITWYRKHRKMIREKSIFSPPYGAFLNANWISAMVRILFCNSNLYLCSILQYSHLRRRKLCPFVPAPWLDCWFSMALWCQFGFSFSSAYLHLASAFSR